MQTFAVTEHMPRPEEDFYPEEVRIDPSPPLLHLTNV
jgi:hypothetical protein